MRDGHANPNAVGNSGCTPLHIAAHLDHVNSVPICKLLVRPNLFSLRLCFFVTDFYSIVSELGVKVEETGHGYRGSGQRGGGGGV